MSKENTTTAKTIVLTMLGTSGTLAIGDFFDSAVGGVVSTIIFSILVVVFIVALIITIKDGMKKKGKKARKGQTK